MIETIDLSGLWQFQFHEPAGQDARQLPVAPYTDAIALPGTVDLAAKAPLNPQMTDTFLMAHLTRKHPFVGWGWYERTFEVCPEQDGRYFHLVLERPHWETTLWLDGLRVGSAESLCIPHRFSLGRLSAGTHTLTLRVDNTIRYAVGDANSFQGFYDLAHSVTDHTQTNWNGVVGRLELQVSDHLMIEALELYPDAGRATLELRVTLRNQGDPRSSEAVVLHTAVTLSDGRTVDLPAELLALDSAHTTYVWTVTLPADAPRWDEFSPALHEVTVSLEQDALVLDQQIQNFGLRDFATRGQQFTINGRPVLLRGTLDCCIFPLTGHPPTDVESWREVYRAVQAYGLNHVRFHSYCPPEAAFQAADELGLYLHVETPVWPELGGDPVLDDFIRREARRIVQEYGHHPSFCILAVGNEPHGEGQHAFLAQFQQEWRTRDPRRVYTGCSGWPHLIENGFHSTPEPRAHRWGEGLDSRFNREALDTCQNLSGWNLFAVPTVTHEMGQWCAFPNLDEIARYSGPVAARNFEFVRDDLAAKGMLPLAHDFLMASGHLQTRLYKEEIESALRTPDYGGIQLLGVQDFPGQGTALVGVMDAFWTPKPYSDPQQFQEFCGPLVPLWSSPRFTIDDGRLRGEVLISQYGPANLDGSVVNWTLRDAGETAQLSGTLSAGTLATGNVHTVGSLDVDVTALETPGQYELLLSVEGHEAEGETRQAQNRWTVWLYPPTQPEDDLEIVTSLDDAVLARLEAGASLIWAPPPETLYAASQMGFTTAFWNVLWTQGQPPHTMGLLCDPAHLALADFPTDMHSDWQWWELVHGRQALHLDRLGVALTPIVRVIDDWNTNRSLALLAEARVGRGRLIISSSDLMSDLERRPVARQMRRSLAQYLQALPSATLTELTPEQLLLLLGESPPAPTTLDSSRPTF
ncbi:glycoside hydrolase family 2 TIM barrel-domain containing protein [Deinococcus marmoris]|uniref:Beta-galactosidase n=1 Tax=Deinococcus marmoris TaxID=249408 RepID=A0A1U7P115_9DEIO|nr:glycoside hydrolase family 2 TIM barrel-domain containing protein [Deinococcus marmoris]OLV18861.1 Beta-galactosidase [Deinococcus marmoris]